MLEAVRFFGNGRPLEIEIGCGRGKFLVARAQSDPATNFIGLDRDRKWMKVGVWRCEKRGLGNLVFIHSDTREFLLEIPPESVSVFHIYFPDPWPKRRHHKRRLVGFDFLMLLNARLRARGRVEIATDDADYFDQIREAAQRTGSFWTSVRESRNQRLAFPDFKTSYELRYEAAARDLYYMELVK